MDALVEGVVIRGDGRGRLLGFPTANVEPSRMGELPPDGVYAGWIELEDATLHVAAISIGRRPTYYDHGDVLLEAHLLDFDGDLYGERVLVEVGEHIRDQRKFSSEKELIEQIESDVAAVRAAAGAPSSALGSSIRAGWRTGG